MIAQLDRQYVATRPTKAISRLVSYALFEGRPITTRGRSINALVLPLLRAACRMPELRPVVKPIFIIGAGRSGTTVLGKVMSMHRDVGFLNEPKALWYLVHPEDDVIGNYTRGPARYRFADDDASPARCRKVHGVLSAYLTTVMSRRALIKYPEFVYRIPYARAIFPDARFLLIIRNGWDTCHSIDRWSRRFAVNENGDRHDWWGVNNRKWKLMVDELVPEDPDLSGALDTVAELTAHTDMAAVEWIISTRAGLRAREEHPGSVHLIRYEDLLADPRRTLEAVTAFCELRPDEEFLRYGERTLQPASDHPRFPLHPALRPHFEATLEHLGYERA